jgi:hypothetical protein
VQKGLCIAALSVSVIVLILFLADLIMGLAGLSQLAPFKYANLILDIVFIVCAGILGVLSWFTMKEQV